MRPALSLGPAATAHLRAPVFRLDRLLPRVISTLSPRSGSRHQSSRRRKSAADSVRSWGYSVRGSDVDLLSDLDGIVDFDGRGIRRCSRSLECPSRSTLSVHELLWATNFLRQPVANQGRTAAAGCFGVSTRHGNPRVAAVRGAQRLWAAQDTRRARRGLTCRDAHRHRKAARDRARSPTRAPSPASDCPTARQC